MLRDGMNRLWFVMMVAVLVVAGGYYLYETNQPGRLVLRFVAFVEDESLVFNQVRYGWTSSRAPFAMMPSNRALQAA